MRLDLIQTVAFAGLMLFVGTASSGRSRCSLATTFRHPSSAACLWPALFALFHAMNWSAPPSTPLCRRRCRTRSSRRSDSVPASRAEARRSARGDHDGRRVGGRAFCRTSSGAHRALARSASADGRARRVDDSDGWPATGLAFAPLFEAGGRRGRRRLPSRRRWPGSSPEV